MDTIIFNQFFNYCFKGDIINAKLIYFSNDDINVRYKNDKIFRFCCEAAKNMDGYNDRFTNHSKKLIDVIKFLCELCNDYKVYIDNNHLIEWKINKIISIKI